MESQAIFQPKLMPKYFIELGPCEVDGVGGGARAALQQVASHLLHHAVLSQFRDLRSLQGDRSSCSLGFVDVKTKVVLQSVTMTPRLQQ